MIAKLLPQTVFLDLTRTLLCRAPARTVKGRHPTSHGRPLPARAEATKGDTGREANARWRLRLSKKRKNDTRESDDPDLDFYRRSVNLLVGFVADDGVIAFLSIIQYGASPMIAVRSILRWHGW